MREESGISCRMATLSTNLDIHGVFSFARWIAFSRIGIADEPAPRELVLAAATDEALLLGALLIGAASSATTAPSSQYCNICYSLRSIILVMDRRNIRNTIGFSQQLTEI
jgi:hypothetical protein